MGFKKEYFPVYKDNQKPLSATIERRIRFEEVDALGMVWHGRYPSYFEDGRIAFGDLYGMTYQSFQDHKTIAPVVQLHLDYRQPLRFDERITIEASLHWAEAARLNFSYTIRNSKKEVCARGYTVQMLTELDGSLMLTLPEWMIKFQQKWRQGSW